VPAPRAHRIGVGNGFGSHHTEYPIGLDGR
jgi:hypothetical protein